MTEPTPNTGGPIPALIPARHQRRRRALVLVISLLAFAALAGLGAWLRQTPGRPPQPAADESLCPRLLQAVLDIVPEGGKGGGCGVLIDQEYRLVATLAAVTAGADEVRVSFPSGVPAQGEQEGPGSVRADKEAGIAAHVVYRDPARNIDLLQVERLPSRALALPPGDWVPAPGQALHTLHRPEPPAPSAGVGAWSYHRGQVERVLMRPHY
jgi:hypothetical protein